MQTGCIKTSWNVHGAVRISRGPYRQKGKGGQPTYRPLWPPKWLFDGYMAGKVSEDEYIAVYNRQLAELPGGAEKVYDDLKVSGGGDSCSTGSNSKLISISSLDKEESDCDDRAREFQGIFLAIDPLMAVCQADIEVDEQSKDIHLRESSWSIFFKFMQSRGLRCNCLYDLFEPDSSRHHDLRLYLIAGEAVASIYMLNKITINLKTASDVEKKHQPASAIIGKRKRTSGSP